MRELRLFAVLDDDRRQRLSISAISDERGYREIRRVLSDQHNLGSREPDIQVWNADIRGDRSLTLRHRSSQRRPLTGDTAAVLKHLARLWGFTVRLETLGEDCSIETAGECRLEKRKGAR